MYSCFKTILEDINSFCGATDTLVMLMVFYLSFDLSRDSVFVNKALSQHWWPLSPRQLIVKVTMLHIHRATWLSVCKQSAVTTLVTSEPSSANCQSDNVAYLPGCLTLFFDFCFFCIFFCFLVGPLIPLFCASGDVSSGFQSKSGQPYSHLAEVYILPVPWDTCLAESMAAKLISST